ncbi:MAG: CsbD family protein [Thermoanaerobaculia bacterium]|nr:CsbD family protein [Thermoanaerobaculia bacterium]
MNESILKGKWHQLKGSAKEKWGELTDNDLTEIEGVHEQLVGKIQERYGKARDEAEQEVRSWERDVGLR